MKWFIKLKITKEIIFLLYLSCFSIAHADDFYPNCRFVAVKFIHGPEISRISYRSANIEDNLRTSSWKKLFHGFTARKTLFKSSIRKSSLLKI